MIETMDADFGETKDLAGDQPDRVAAMATVLDAHLTATDALIPKLNPEYAGNTVGEWFGTGDATLSATGGVLHIEAGGRTRGSRRSSCRARPTSR